LRPCELKIGVFIATYNGEKYIKEQIESIQKQTIANIDIVINDDCSRDDTFIILKRIAEEDPRIRLSQVKCGGACENFLYLLKSNTSYDCVFLSDQDDVWLSNKIEKFLDLYLKKGKSAEPVLLYCDKEYVDEKLVPLNVVKRVYRDSFKNILFQNHIYGCTMMINNALLNKIPLLDNIAMHDHLISLTAAVYGNIYYIDKKLVKYRQHEANVTGGINQFGYLNKIISWKNVNRRQMETFQMCREFCCLHKHHNKVAYEYLNMLDSNGFFRIVRAVKYGFKADRFLSTLRLYFVMVKYGDKINNIGE